MKTATVKEIFDFQKKSKIKAGEGLEGGKYPFYTSSETLSKYLDSYLYEPTCLVFGTGGKANVHLAARRFATSTDCIVIKPKPEIDVDVDYVFQFFKGNMQILEKGFKGAGLKHISKTYLSGIKIPLPPLDDQIRIAHLLGKVEGLIARRKQHLQQLDELLKSVFLEMFGDPVKNPKGFPVKKLSEFYINSKEGTKCGPFGSALKKDEFVDSGVPVWNMDNIDPAGRMLLPFRMWITEEKYQKLSSYDVLDGDIIISRAGTVGKMCVAKMNNVPAIISTNLIRLRLNHNLLPLFFVSLMTYCKGRVGRLKTGADGAFTHMNTGILNKLEFPYPPLPLQNQFAAIVEKVEGIKTQYQQSLTELENLYGALSQKAFKGELDLSRVPLVRKEPDEQQEKESDVKAEEMTEEETMSIELPEPADLSSLAMAAGRRDAIENWLASYLEQLDGKAFDVGQFMQLAQLKLDELIEDETPELGVDEYDWIKERVFHLLENGQMTQAYDDDKNRVLIKGQGNNQS